MPLQLTYYGHPALRSKGRRIDTITPEIHQLAQEMLEAMYQHQGCGLAAQQVGCSLQLAVIDILPGEETRPSKAWKEGKPIDIESLMPLVLINPEIIPVGSKKNYQEEACLSIPGVWAKIHRPSRILIRYQSLEGKTLEIEASGLLARAAMHEVDHLHGILFIDHLSPQEQEKHQPLLHKLMRENSMR